MIPILMMGQKELSVPTKVSEVTVYKQGASVTRSTELQLPADECVLTFDGFRNDIDLNSVQFNSEGDMTVLNIRKGYRVDTLGRTGPAVLPDVEALQEKVSDITTEKTRLQKLLDVYAREESFLQQNLDLKGKEEAVDLDELMRAVEFARERYLNIRQKQAEIEDQMALMDEEVKVLREKMAQTVSYQTQRVSEVVVRIKSHKTQKAKVELKYFDHAAGWSPSYEARVNSVSEDVNLTQFAKVYQRTGEDWKNIYLTITNGDPQRNQTRPGIQPRYIQSAPTIVPQSSKPSVRNLNTHLLKRAYDPHIRSVSGRVYNDIGEPMPFVTVQVTGTNTGATTDINGNYQVQIPANAPSLTFSYVGSESIQLPISLTRMDVTMVEQNVQLEEVAVQSISGRRINAMSVAGTIGNADVLERKEKREKVEFQTVKLNYTPTIVRFEIDGKQSVPADGELYDFAIQELELPSEYQYEAVPAVDPSAFLTARVSGWEKYNLLSGPLHIYLEKSYIGKAQLNIQSLEDTLSLSLGRDPGINISYATLKSSHARKFIASKKHLERHFRTTIKNNKADNVKLVIYDQVPVSYHDDVKVELEEYGTANLEEDSGILRWDITLGSGENNEFDLKYEIVYPPSVQLNAGL